MSNESNLDPVEKSIKNSYESLEQLCGTPNIYRQFEMPSNGIPKSPHQHATFIYQYFRNNSEKFCLTLEFDQATIMDLLNQKKKENRLFYKIREAYLHDHTTVARHNLKELFFHFVRILEHDKSSINGLSLNYITVLFAPIIISVKINDNSNPVLKAAVQTAIFQTIYHRYIDFFQNMDRTNQIIPTKKGTIIKTDTHFNITEKEDCWYYQLKYKKNGEEKDDDYLMVRTSKGIGICPKQYVQANGIDQVQQAGTTSKDDLSEKEVQYYHDFF